jgi:hypothetical protein
MHPVEDNAVNADNDPPVVVNVGNDPEVENEEELVDPVLDDGPVVEVPIIEENIEIDMDNRYGVGNSWHDLRARKPQDYSHLHTTRGHTCMKQYSVKKGLKEFGQAGADAVRKEMKQLDDRDVIEPRQANMLTQLEKHRPLHYLMFLKKKQCGKLKGRGCADGRKQRVYKAKEETSAPTVAIEPLMLS